MAAEMGTTFVLVLAAYWAITTLIVGPILLAFYHKVSYREEANELLRADITSVSRSQQRPGAQTLDNFVYPASASWVPYGFFEFLPKRLARFFVYVPAALIVTFVLPQYVFPLLGLQAGGQDLTRNELAILLLIFLPLAIVVARYLTLGLSGLWLYSFVRGFFLAGAINIPLIALVILVYQLWTGLMGISKFISSLMFLPILYVGAYLGAYKLLGLFAWVALLVNRFISGLSVGTSYLATALFCFWVGVIHAPESTIGEGLSGTIRTWGYFWAGLLIPCALFIAITLPVLRVLSWTPALSPGKAPLKLLFLRSFSSGRRSARLFRSLVSAWTEFGPVYTLSGPDIFLKTMDSKTFLAYLRKDLRSAFISSPQEAHTRVANIRDKASIDGRHRVEEFRCRGNVWEAVFEALLQRCDVALLDLRGFEGSHRGTRHELVTVLKAGHQGKVLFLTDDTTNKSDLEEVIGAVPLEEVVGAVPEGGGPPNARSGALEITLTEVTGLGPRVAHAVLPLLIERAKVSHSNERACG